MRRQAFGERNPQVGPDRFYNERMVHGNNRDVPQSEGEIQDFDGWVFYI